MIKVALMFADGTEEIESLTSVDILRRAGAKCDIFSVSGKMPKGSHGIQIVADDVAENLNMNNYDAIVIPGGMPGAITLSNDIHLKNALEIAVKQNKIICAICASPAVVLAKYKITDGKKATCYPADNFISLLKNAEYTANDVEIDGNIITANGVVSALPFAFQIVKKLGLTVNL